MELFAAVASLAGLQLQLPQARDEAALLLVDSCDAVPEFARLTRHVGARLRFLGAKLDIQKMRRQMAQLPRLAALAADLRQFERKQRLKTLVLRVATARVVVEDLQALHGAIDEVSVALGLNKSDFEGHEELSPLGRRQRIQEDVEGMRCRLEGYVATAGPLIKGLSDEQVLEGLAVLKYDLDHSKHRMSKRLHTILSSAFNKIVRSSKVRVPYIPSWFVRLDDGSSFEDVRVDNCFASEIDRRSRPGEWSPHMRAVIRQIEVDPAGFERKEFIKATELWLTLSHKHVVKLCGGSHLNSTAFVAYEDAITDSFATCFAHDRETSGDDKSEDNSRLARFWQLFSEIAEGVEYLHSKGIMHGDLRCCNFVISVDGTAKVCDFVDRASKKAEYRQRQTVRWKAPECVVADGPDPSFEGDIFMLGLSLYEAWKGGEPLYGILSDEEIIERYGEIIERNDGGAEDGIRIPDEDLEVIPSCIRTAVERLCKYNPMDRPKITEVVEIFRECSRSRC